MRKICLYFIVLSTLIGIVSMAHAGKLSSYPSTAVLQNGDLIPVVIISGDSNANINWSSLKAIVTTGINWQALPSIAQNYNINWNDIKLQQKNQGLTSGINWNDLSPVAGGVNWTTVTKAAADNTILCVKDGQIGKCVSTFSASGAGSCTCI